MDPKRLASVARPWPQSAWRRRLARLEAENRALRSELALSGADAHFRQVIDASPVPLSVDDMKGTIEYVNRKFAERFGYTRAEVPTSTAWFARAYPNPVYRRQVAREWKACIKRGLATGKEIGPLAGSCGTAAFLKQQVIVTDIENDEHWAAYKHLALQYDLRACWSYPIIDSEGNAIAVFGIYYDKVKTPGEAELSIIERSAAILKMILENKLYEETIVEMNMMISQGQALANFGTWQWDINNNQVTWSDELFNIYGQNKQGFKATFEGYVERLHPLDRERVQGIITNALSAKKDFTFEERVVRPGGEIRHLKSWGRVMVSETGKPIKMIGACLDITQAKTTETKMEEIAWLQSHVIRAPLARLMGLAGMLHDELKLNGEQLELLDNIVDAAHELDKVIRNITTKTYM